MAMAFSGACTCFTARHLAGSSSVKICSSTVAVQRFLPKVSSCNALILANLDSIWRGKRSLLTAFFSASFSASCELSVSDSSHAWMRPWRSDRTSSSSSSISSLSVNWFTTFFVFRKTPLHESGVRAVADVLMSDLQTQAPSGLPSTSGNVAHAISTSTVRSSGGRPRWPSPRSTRATRCSNSVALAGASSKYNLRTLKNDVPSPHSPVSPTNTRYRSPLKLTSRSLNFSMSARSLRMPKLACCSSRKCASNLTKNLWPESSLIRTTAFLPSLITFRATWTSFGTYSSGN
mmetsp:Transcript_47107/g.100850  ORF Transcript_47107/g.100850 Transcript_47107/m.100850 type:complete len:290 (+) Transcript_47107:356-1225(+)